MTYTLNKNNKIENACKLITLVATIFLMSSCSSSKHISSGNASLKDAFKKDFLIGTALNTEQIAAEQIPVQ